MEREINVKFPLLRHFTWIAIVGGLYRMGIWHIRWKIYLMLHFKSGWFHLQRTLQLLEETYFLKNYKWIAWVIIAFWAQLVKKFEAQNRLLCDLVCKHTSYYHRSQGSQTIIILRLPESVTRVWIFLLTLVCKNLWFSSLIS